MISTERCRSAASSSRAWAARARTTGMDDYVEIKYLCLGDILK